MPRYEDDYRPRGQPTRRLEESVREDRHRLDRGEARERIRILDDSHAERPIRSDRDRERIPSDRGDRHDRGQRMDFTEDARIGVPRGDPRANPAVRREDRERETITVYRDAHGRLYDAQTHELLDIPARPVPRPRGDNYDDDMEMDRDELPRRRAPDREPLYYEPKPRGPRGDDYDDVVQGSLRSDFGKIKTFVDGTDIEHRVIQTDICRHLGNDATVCRATQDGRDGYIVSAYRAPTTAQLEDLKRASANYRRNRLSEMPPGTYAEMRSREDRARDGRARDGRARDDRARDDRDAMDVDMEYDPPSSRDRHRGELEPRGGERIDRHRTGAVPVTTGYVESSYPGYAIGPGQGPYGAAQRPRTTGNYSPQGGRSGQAAFPPATFDNRTPPVSMAPVPPTTRTYRDPRTNQYIPIDQGVGGGFVPEPARGSGRHGR